MKDSAEHIFASTERIFFLPKYMKIIKKEIQFAFIWAYCFFFYFYLYIDMRMCVCAYLFPRQDLPQVQF